MRYKAPRLELELDDAHPDLMPALLDFEEWCSERGRPEPVVTSVKRTPEENRRVGGHPLSWHLFGCAVDVRANNLPPEHQREALVWWQRRCPRPEWEVLLHGAGESIHFHVGRRDASWRNTYPPAKE